jgi:drug/metabolite transporter (DMT)-like permease
MGRSVTGDRSRPAPVDRRGALAAAVSAMLYGSAYVATALALRSFTPLGTGALRGLLGAALLAALLLAPIAAAHRPRELGAGALLRLATLGGLAGPVFVVAMNIAVDLAGATVTAFVAGLYAVLAAALGVPLLGERLERRTVAWLGLALAGTLLLSDLRPSAHLATGIVVGLGAAVAFALFLVLSRRWSAAHRLTGPVVALAGLSEMGVGIAIYALLAGDPGIWAPVRPEAVAAVVWLAVGPGMLAAMLVVRGMQRLPARRASAFLLLNPPTATIGAWLLLDERLTPTQLVGGGLVLVAIAGASGLLRARGVRAVRPPSAAA